MLGGRVWGYPTLLISRFINFKRENFFGQAYFLHSGNQVFAYHAYIFVSCDIMNYLYIKKHVCIIYAWIAHRWIVNRWIVYYELAQPNLISLVKILSWGFLALTSLSRILTSSVVLYGIESICLWWKFFWICLILRWFSKYFFITCIGILLFSMLMFYQTNFQLY